MTNKRLLSIRELVIVAFGVIAIVMFDTTIPLVITGTDPGTVVIQDVMRVVAVTWIMLGVALLIKYQE